MYVYFRYNTKNVNTGDQGAPGSADGPAAQRAREPGSGRRPFNRKHMRQQSRNSYKDYEYEMRAAKLTIQTPPVIRTLYPEDGPNRG